MSRNKEWQGMTVEAFKKAFGINPDEEPKEELRDAISTIHGGHATPPDRKAVEDKTPLPIEEMVPMTDAEVVKNFFLKQADEMMQSSCGPAWDQNLVGLTGRAFDPREMSFSVSEFNETEPLTGKDLIERLQSLKDPPEVQFIRKQFDRGETDLKGLIIGLWKQLDAARTQTTNSEVQFICSSLQVKIESAFGYGRKP